MPTCRRAGTPATHGRRLRVSHHAAAESQRPADTTASARTASLNAVSSGPTGPAAEAIPALDSLSSRSTATGPVWADELPSFLLPTVALMLLMDLAAAEAARAGESGADMTQLAQQHAQPLWQVCCALRFLIKWLSISIWMLSSGRNHLNAAIWCSARTYLGLCQGSAHRLACPRAVRCSMCPQLLRVSRLGSSCSCLPLSKSATRCEHRGLKATAQRFLRLRHACGSASRCTLSTNVGENLFSNLKKPSKLLL